jgi:hypothetical protein
MQVALESGGTLIPPPMTPLGPGQTFRCTQWQDLDLDAWIDLVGTRWTREELAIRLEAAWIPCIYKDRDLVATCVLRVLPTGTWILETLRARKGFGGPLLRAVIPWLYDMCKGPVPLTYTWELRLASLIGAWWRGWLRTAAAVQYGWIWTADVSDANCGFCPNSAWEPLGPRLVRPTLFHNGQSSAVVSDSGLGDGWGYVSVFRGKPDWAAIAATGGWRVLWVRAATAPEGFRWSGDVVVIGVLNNRDPNQKTHLEWITAEIASPF